MVTIDIDSVKGTVVGTVSGTLTLDDIREAAAAVWRDVEAPRVRVLWDLREARFTLSVTEVQDLAEFARLHSPFDHLRMAFVVAGDLEFGQIRMFDVFRETATARTEVFRDMEKALSWLAAVEP